MYRRESHFRPIGSRYCRKQISVFVINNVLGYFRHSRLIQYPLGPQLRSALFPVVELEKMRNFGEGDRNAVKVATAHRSADSWHGEFHAICRPCVEELLASGKNTARMSN